MFPIYYQNEKTNMVVSVQTNGRAWEKFECELDLVNIPTKLIGWVNLYRKKDSPVGFACRFIFDTEQRARENAYDNTITRKIELEVL